MRIERSKIREILKDIKWNYEPPVVEHLARIIETNGRLTSAAAQLGIDFLLIEDVENELSARGISIWESA